MAGDVLSTTFDALLAIAVGLLAWRLTASWRVTWPVLRPLIAYAAGFGVLARRIGWPDTTELIVTIVIAIVLGYVFFRKQFSLLRPTGAMTTTSRQREVRSPREFTSDYGPTLVDAMDAPFGSTRLAKCQIPVGSRPEWPKWVAVGLMFVGFGAWALAIGPALSRDFMVVAGISLSAGAVLVAAIVTGWKTKMKPADRAGARAVHRWGTFATGVFTPDPQLVGEGQPFAQGDELHVIARFSNFSGAANRDDTACEPHGLAIKFVANEQRPGMDIVTIDLDRFFVSTRADFMAFSRYFAGGPMTRVLGVGRMLLVGSTRLKAIQALLTRNAPTTYLDLDYHGVNAFIWQLDGADVVVRYLVSHVPDIQERKGRRKKRKKKEAPTESGSEARKLHDHLVDALKGDKRIHLKIEMVDGTDLPRPQQLDALRPWPKKNIRRPLGTVTLCDLAEEAKYDNLVFDPHHLWPEVRPSDDEILMARRAAYAESHVRRARAKRKADLASASVGSAPAWDESREVVPERST